MMSRAAMFVLAVTALHVAVPAAAEAPLKVGETHSIVIASSGPTAVDPVRTDRGWLWELYHPGATYLAVHFDRFDLAPGERLVITDGAGGQAAVLAGQGKMDAGRFWSRHVRGDTLFMELILSTGDPRHPRRVRGGFEIDAYAAGFAELPPLTKAICGDDDKENAICYASSYPTEYDRARAVARLLINGSSLCTGWLASADNHLITNEHCITSSSDALNTDYEFMSEAPNCSDSNCQLCHDGVVFSGATFIQDSASLDYALVQITSGDPAGTYGHLDIDDRSAVVGEQIYIPQHPGGRAKELGILSSASADGGGVCTVSSTSEPPCSGSGYNDVGYYCDTEGGSSGSPVLATSSHKVIALHHCANCPNRGVPITLVYAEIADFLGACGDGVCNGAEDPCSCPGDCGSPPTTETACDDGIDNDCDGATDCDDLDCDGSSACLCDYDGVCETGEDCTNCPNDCISGSGGAVCGNGLCEAGDGEDCQTCPADCAGITTGRPSGRFCCGTSIGCGDSRCTSGGYQCTTTPQGTAYCCGDGVCEGSEDALNCAIDCDSGSSYCGDGTCDPGEDLCSCSEDCGFPPSSEVPNDTCADGLDNDCDGAADCNDPDCETDPACSATCQPLDAPCTSDVDCCSLKCRGRPGGMTCK